MKWTIEKIKDIIENKTHESVNLEFKRGESLLNAKNKSKGGSEFCKDVSAFANSNGGTIIYGIEEAKINGGGYAQSIMPINKNAVSLEWIETYLHGNITPKIKNIEISSVSIDDSNHIIIINIPKSDTVHQASDKRYYKRFNFSSVPMEDYEVKDVMNRSKLPVLNVFLTPRQIIPPNRGYEYEIIIIIHNIGVVGANYIECYVEFDKKYIKYIDVPENIYSRENIVQILFSNEVRKYNKKNNSFDFQYFRPILPSVYFEIGRIVVKKEFLHEKFDICCSLTSDAGVKKFQYNTTSILLDKLSYSGNHRD